MIALLVRISAGPWQPAPQRDRTRWSGRIRRLGIALVLLFAVVFAQLAYVQVFAADDIKGNPANFSRQLIAEYNVQRGKILTADGLVLAESVPAPKGSRYRYERRYPQGDLYGYITGYYSRIYGRSALEESMNTYLSGEAPELAISTFTDLFLGRREARRERLRDDRSEPPGGGAHRAREQRGSRRRDGSRAPATSWPCTPRPGSTRASSRAGATPRCDAPGSG